jgi:Polyketide cyclase / dehydrase and lipid transport
MDDLVVINRSIKEVFAFVSDHSNDNLWKPFVTESRQISAGPIGVGTRFEIVTVAWGYRRSGEVEVLEYEPQSLYVYRANDKLLPFIAQLTFAPVPSGTAICGQVKFQAHGMWKLLSPLPLMFFRSQTKRTFARLKQVLEGLEETAK